MLLKNSFFSPFRICIIFISILLFTLPILSKQNINLNPTTQLPTITISYSYPNSPPVVIEEKITSIIESSCSQISDLKSINSISTYNRGNISLTFDKRIDIQKKEFELTSLLRQVYPKLPYGLQFPTISSNHENSNAEPALLIYSLNSDMLFLLKKQHIEERILQTLSTVAEIQNITISSLKNYQLTVQFDKSKCAAWNINPVKIQESLQSHFKTSYPGSHSNNNGEEYYLYINTNHTSLEEIENLLVPSNGTNLIRIKDLASVYIEEREPNSYYRKNGKDAIKLAIYPTKNANKVALSKSIKKKLWYISERSSSDLRLNLEYDEIGIFNEEFSRNYIRIVLSFLILLILILVVYKSWKTFFILLLTIIGSSCITIIFSFFLQLNINIYSIAALSISFGLIIDNFVILLDNLKSHTRQKIFPAIFASTSITIIAVSFTFLLPENQKNNLSNFSTTIILSLVSSLVSAYLFIPSFYFLFVKKVDVTLPGYSTKKLSALLFTILYYKIVPFIANYKKTFFSILIFIIGVPIFLLPEKLDNNILFHNLYNKTIGSIYYQESLRPTIDKWTGGIFRNFVMKVRKNSGYRNIQKTKLFISAKLPIGSSLQNLNDLLKQIESYLKNQSGIDQFVTKATNPQQGVIEITFKDTHLPSFPHILKNQLINKSLEWGGVEWDIYGIGQGFSNTLNNSSSNFKIAIKGYNYDELEKYTVLFEEEIKKSDRVVNININEKLFSRDLNEKEFVLNISNEKILLKNTTQTELLTRLQYLSHTTAPSLYSSINNHNYPVIIKEKSAEYFSNTELLNSNIWLNPNLYTKVSTIGEVELRETFSAIYKHDRQYVKIIGFEYLGLSQNANLFLKKTVQSFQLKLPIGYTIASQDLSGAWSLSPSNYKHIVLLASFILIICCILLENIKQSFIVLGILPIAFVGIFLAFSIGQFFFDQGGYASFLIVGGMMSTASIIIINDYNNVLKKQKLNNSNKLLINILSKRVKTVVITSLSTCLSFVPFLLEGGEQAFWFPISIGTLGGTLFTLVGVFLILPITLWKKN